jgi:glycosyltransferase involved in cell wall biosynthesis
LAYTAESIEPASKELTICVCTYNSGRTLRSCLSSIRRAAPFARLVVVDHLSSDGTPEMAKTFGCEVFSENVGLGKARQLSFELTTSSYLAFVDSDVDIIMGGFFTQAMRCLDDPGVGAVVGMGKGHTMSYGLPASLLLLRKGNFLGKVVPPEIDARETYFIQKRLDSLGLRTVYLADCIVHRSEFRLRKPEWEGANTRIVGGVSIHELAFCFEVMVLMSINSRSIKNLAYVPISYLKFLRGFVEPEKWRRLERSDD